MRASHQALSNIALGAHHICLCNQTSGSTENLSGIIYQSCINKNIQIKKQFNFILKPDVMQHQIVKDLKISDEMFPSAIIRWKFSTADLNYGKIFQDLNCKQTIRSTKNISHILGWVDLVL